MAHPLEYEELKSPVTVQMELTPRCNHKCIHCYNSWRGKKKLEDELRSDDFLGLARRVVAAEVFEVVLTGGEPLLRRDLVYPSASYFSSQNLDVTLNTNLSLVNEDDARNIKSAGIRSVFASLPSHDPETFNRITQTNNFERVIAGIEVILGSRISLGVNMVVNQMNKHQVYDTGKFLHNLGIRLFAATPASPCEYLKPELELSSSGVVHTLDQLLRLRDEFGMKVDVVEPLPRCIALDKERYKHFLRRDCAAGKLTVAISPSGKVRPCTHVPQEYGDLRTEDLGIIWKRMIGWRDGRYVPKKCTSCAELKTCSLGCREAARLKEGDYNGLDPWACTDNALSSPPKEPEEIFVDPKTNLAITPGLKYRKENQGYLIFSSENHSISYVNPAFFKFIKFLRKKGRFTIKELEIEFKDPDKITAITKYLNNKTLIKPW